MGCDAGGACQGSGRRTVYMHTSVKQQGTHAHRRMSAIGLAAPLAVSTCRASSGRTLSSFKHVHGIRRRDACEYVPTVFSRDQRHCMADSQTALGCSTSADGMRQPDPWPSSVIRTRNGGDHARTLSYGVDPCLAQCRSGGGTTPALSNETGNGRWLSPFKCAALEHKLPRP